MKILEVSDLIRNYQKSMIRGRESAGDIKVLKEISFSVEEKDFTGIMGKSGCGKTTLLKVLGIIDRPTKGKVFFKEKDTGDLKDEQLAEIRRKGIGFVFQDFYLMDSLSVRENIMLPMILDKEGHDVMKKTVENNAAHFEITDILEKYPYEISGGQKQRVAICRALSNQPDLILADEPTGNLDSNSAKTVIESLEKINEELGKTILMVTHDPQVASHCKKIIFLKDGKILDTYERKGTEREFYQSIVEKMIDL